MNNCGAMQHSLKRDYSLIFNIQVFNVVLHITVISSQTQTATGEWKLQLQHIQSSTLSLTATEEEKTRA